MILFWRLSLLLTLALSSSAASAEGGAVNHAQAQIEWLRSRGGFFSPKLNIRNMNQDDPSSPRGMFAEEDVNKGEMLITIPRRCLLTSGARSPARSQDTCATTRRLMKEYQLGDESEYAPYVKYLFSQKPGILPSAWSQAGKDLLHTLVLPELLKVDGLTSSSFQEECGGSGDPFEERAFLLVIGRSWDDKLVPIYDMINHGRGRLANVDSNSAHRSRDIFIFASRDIAAGEQIQYAYNECTDCEDLELYYVLHHMLRDFGFVEQYPQRWRFRTKPDIVFDIDLRQDTAALNGTTQDPQLEVTWLTEMPDQHTRSFLLGHLRRLQNIESEVYYKAAKLGSDHERGVIIDLLKGLKVALENAIWSDGNDFDEDCENSDEETCAVKIFTYDDLSETPDTLDYEAYRCGDVPETYDIDNYENKIDVVNSQYQEISFFQNEKTGDTCLRLSQWLQTCNSFRPHYHEVIVHYSARFIQNVRRVIYLGGGDNMLLHEILKYPSLELVVGLELDQQVVRSSLKNLGTQPHFDNEKVQWWFGDAAKSLLMLPKEFYGSFDLVLVDLQTNVVEELMVTKYLTILDVAVLLVAPDGIIAKNDDFVPRTSPDFVDYTVDMNYHEVPILCEQAITLGSNKFDLLTRELKDHKVPTLFLKPFDEMHDHFGMWYNYVKNTTRINKLCKLPGLQAADILDGTEDNPGALMVIEIEEVDHPLDDSAKDAITGAVKQTGLTITHELLQDKTLLYILREGYVLARMWPELRYCAFDIHLWSSFEKQNHLEAELVSALSSKVSSSYRVVTGGMFSDSIIEDNKRRNGPRVTEMCSGAADTSAQVRTEPNIDAVVSQSVFLIQPSEAVVAVICDENSRPCISLDAVRKAAGSKKAVAVWTCSDVANPASPPSDGMVACEKETKQSFEDLVRRSGRISGIVLDPQVPRAMGQILYKLFSKSRFRRKVMTNDSYVIISPIPDPSEGWRRELLERFRREISVFDPSHRAQIFFNGTESSLELGVFSSGDASFYSHLRTLVYNTKEATKLKVEIRQVKNGILSFVAQFLPSDPSSPQDYDPRASLEQWRSQKPLGLQQILHLDLKPSLSNGERVLIGRYQRPGIIKKRTGDGTYNVQYDDDGGGKKSGLPREKIQELEKHSPVTAKQALEAFSSALPSMEGHGFQSNSIKVYNDFGDGCVIVAIWPSGTAILVWNGRSHMDVNFFTLDQSEKPFERFASAFVDSLDFDVMSSYDLQPRGLGRVVNFRSDLEHQDRIPHWAH